MTRLRMLVVVALVVFIAQSKSPHSIASSESSGASLPSFAEPALSPDRSEIAFVSGGDIWTVPSAGGEARLLVSHPATESRPLYSPDGRKLAFISNRTGNGDIYVLAFGRVSACNRWDADRWSREPRRVAELQDKTELLKQIGDNRH